MVTDEATAAGQLFNAGQFEVERPQTAWGARSFQEHAIEPLAGHPRTNQSRRVGVPPRIPSRFGDCAAASGRPHVEQTGGHAAELRDLKKRKRRRRGLAPGWRLMDG